MPPQDLCAHAFIVSQQGLSGFLIKAMPIAVLNMYSANFTPQNVFKPAGKDTLSYE